MTYVRIAGALVVAGVVIVLIGISSAANRSLTPAASAEPIALPSPMLLGTRSLEEVLAARRSVREFAPDSLTEAEIGQLLWAAQGVTGPDGRRTAPSAGATYPLELVAVTAAGACRYLPDAHALRPVRPDDVRADLAVAADQGFVADVPLIVVVAAVPSRTEGRYGSRAERYVILEAGHATQNLLLQAVALGLGAVPVGAFDDAAVARAVGLDSGERALYLVPIGHPR